MKRETFDETIHKLFAIKVTDYNGDMTIYNVFGHDSLKSEAGVYQACISFPHDGIVMIKHADGIALSTSFATIEIYVHMEAENSEGE